MGERAAAENANTRSNSGPAYPPAKAPLALRDSSLSTLQDKAEFDSGDHSKSWQAYSRIKPREHKPNRKPSCPVWHESMERVWCDFIKPKGRLDLKSPDDEVRKRVWQRLGRRRRSSTLKAQGQSAGQSQQKIDAKRAVEAELVRKPRSEQPHSAVEVQRASLGAHLATGYRAPKWLYEAPPLHRKPRLSDLARCHHRHHLRQRTLTLAPQTPWRGCLKKTWHDPTSRTMHHHLHQ